MTTLTIPQPRCAVAPTRLEGLVLRAARRVEATVARRIAVRVARARVDDARARAYEDALAAANRITLGPTLR